MSFLDKRMQKNKLKKKESKLNMPKFLLKKDQKKNYKEKKSRKRQKKQRKENYKCMTIKE